MCATPDMSTGYEEAEKAIYIDETPEGELKIRAKLQCYRFTSKSGGMATLEVTTPNRDYSEEDGDDDERYKTTYEMVMSPDFDEARKEGYQRMRDVMDA